ncbi:hypothetical protein FISHEDRAFT_65949 [Fistulina hepatica ATCC 64428]|uniref:Branched-chain-amino-acid aminotransferase-like protein 2 n=1 Tax=Fistulina hepatica ATCC 64428 TaxID=1128425 RepID=A0A0D7ACW2_9AGAR|nr:hypothetical protein FISHEDRAFT_65949 [Fistulina hepatica ATCC 64428]
MTPRENSPIFLWCHPRSVSSAFERAFLTCSDEFICLHEPLSQAFYYGPEHISPRYVSEPPPILGHATTRSVHSLIFDRQRATDLRRVFVKDMAQFAISKPFQGRSVLSDPADATAALVFPLSSFAKAQHTFLIRDPRKSIPSLYALSIDKDRSGWDSFLPSEAGYAEQVLLFRIVTEVLHLPTVVVDADDLCARPLAALKAYCDAIGVSFTREMCSWQEGPVDTFGTWKGWHDDAERSTGFVKRECADQPRMEGLPESVAKCIDSNIPHFEYLHERRLRF